MTLEVVLTSITAVTLILILLFGENLYGRLFIKPNLKIEDPRVEIHDKINMVLFTVRNKGKAPAQNLVIKVRVVNVWGEFQTLNPYFPKSIQPSYLYPTDPLKVKLCEIHEGDRAISIHTEPFSDALTMSREYDIEVKFMIDNRSPQDAKRLLLLDARYPSPQLRFKN